MLTVSLQKGCTEVLCTIHVSVSYEIIPKEKTKKKNKTYLMIITQVFFFNMKQKPALGKRLLLCLSDKSTCPPLLISKASLKRKG